MRYSDFPFPEGTPLLPDWQTILQYLKDYARDIEHLIEFQTKVLDVRPESSNGKKQWTVTSISLQSRVEKREIYDAVVVANGRYDDP